jgi:hypothetical protein
MGRRQPPKPPAALIDVVQSGDRRATLERLRITLVEAIGAAEPQSMARLVQERRAVMAEIESAPCAGDWPCLDFVGGGICLSGVLMSRGSARRGGIRPPHDAGALNCSSVVADFIT